MSREGWGGGVTVQNVSKGGGMKNRVRKQTNSMGGAFWVRR